MLDVCGGAVLGSTLENDFVTAPPQCMQRNSVSLSSSATLMGLTFQNGS